MAETFGVMLRRYREQRGLTKAELALRLGAGRASVTDWEAGNRVPRDRARLEDLAQTLGLGQAESDALFAAARGFALPDHGRAVAVPTVSDAEAHYLSNLIAMLEQRNKGVLAYVELAALADVPEEDAATRRRIVEGFPLEFSLLLGPLQRGRLDTPDTPQKIGLGNILEAVQQHPRFVLIGDPGAGKTTTLQRLVVDAARMRRTDGNTPLPLLLTLPTWRDEPTPAAFIRAHWSLQSLSDDPLPLLARGEVWLYLDGLNEMGVDGSRKARLLREWLHASDSPKHVIITCRAEDYAGDLLLDLPTVVAEPLDDKRIERFATAYLGDQAPLFLTHVLPKADRNRNDTRYLFHLAQNPYLLSALMFVYQQSSDGYLPRNPGALFQGLVAALWAREKERQTFGWVPLDTMLGAFATLAFAIIDQGLSVVVPTTWAVQLILAQGPQDAASVESLFHIGQRANLLRMQGSQLQFSHELLQEYFAAVELARRGVETCLKRPRFGWAGRMATPWDNVIVALCGIARDADALVRTIMAVDPLFAGRCLRSGALVTPTTQHHLTTCLLLALHDPNREASAAAAWALAEIGDAALPGLLEALRDPVWRARISATLALKEIGDAALPGLLEALRDPDTDVRSRAARALGEIGNVEAVPKLIDILRDLDTNVRRAAVEALGEIGDAEAVPKLIDVLRNPERGERDVAAKAQRQIGGAAAVPGLLEALRDPDTDVRSRAARALGRIRDMRAVPRLLDVLHDPDAHVRKSTVEALKRIGTPEAVAAVAAWEQAEG